MKIYIKEQPSTWVLEGDTFFCEHETIELVDYVQDHMGFDGHYQTEHQRYVCSECDEEIEDYDADM